MLVNRRSDGEVWLVVGEVGSLIKHRLGIMASEGIEAVIVTPNKVDLPYEQIVKTFEPSDLGRGREEVDGVVDAVIVNLESRLEKELIYNLCKRKRVPINTINTPDLCTFTFPSIYEKGDLSIALTTNGNGCKLGNRIKREIVSCLPNDIDEIVQNIGRVRSQILAKDSVYDDDDELNLSLNKLVKEFNMDEHDLKFKRINWLNQIIEYYPLSKLKDITVSDLNGELKHEVTKTGSWGSISLVGAGPGSLSLLTKGAIDEIISADLVLADKLVPQQVLDIIPKKTEVFIARKFPGNAEKAQQELLDLGLDALKKGLKVVRLKQGDPYIFGRGGEEFLFFQSHAFTPKVIPGISSALSGPLLADIPLTHRDVSDQVLICTGTGRRGKLPNIPEFVETRTTIFLMALHRINEFVEGLLSKSWQPDLPAAIIERASCPDERIIRCKLHELPAMVEKYGSMPPGLIVTGYAVNVLTNQELTGLK